MSTKPKFKTVHFYTTKYVSNLTRALSQVFLRDLKIMTSGITCDQIITASDVVRNREKPGELMFILIPQLMVPDSKSLPDPHKYCIYQLEQLNDKNKNAGGGGGGGGDDGVVVKTVFDAVMTQLIRNSVATYDYSAVNVTHYPSDLQPFVKVLVPPIYNQGHQIGKMMTTMMMPATNMYPIDILFYGGINSRRESILKHVTSRLQTARITVVNRVFGDELVNLISKARLVLNIHYYTNSILETDRIHTALQFDHVTVVSEYPTQRDGILSAYEAHPRVLFCDEIVNADDARQIEKVVQTCINALEINNMNIKINNNVSASASASATANNLLNALCSKMLTTSHSSQL